MSNTSELIFKFVIFNAIEPISGKVKFKLLIVNGN